MSGTGCPLYARFYSKRKGAYLDTDIIPTNINYQTDIRTFSGTFDLEFEVNNQSDLTVLQSHDVVEFFFILPSGNEHQIGVGYLGQSKAETNATSSLKRFNGYQLINQLLKPPFIATQHYASTTLMDFARKAVNGEYLGTYCKRAGLNPVVGIKHYSGSLRVSTDLTQTKGALLQQYADLAINIFYQNRLGQLVIYGGDGNTVSRGQLIKGVNIESLSVTSDPDKVISEIIYFFSSAQSDLDRNKVNSPIILNTDPRVRGVYAHPTFRTFASSDLQVFDTTPDERIKKIGKSLIRKSNSYLAQVVVTTDQPFFTSNGVHTPYEEGQEWTIVSDMNEIPTKDNPDGAKQADMILAGIHYPSTPDQTKCQLMFIEKGTLL